jgi:phosphate transport system substrate-binding protein
MKRACIRPLLLISILGSLFPALAQPIRIQCSESLLGLSRQWTNAFSLQHTDARFQVTGGSTVAALGALADQKIQVAVVSRSMRYKETQACEAAFRQRPIEYKVAVNGVAVYVNAANSVNELTYDELAGIFKGKLRNWKELGGKDAPIVAFGLETNTPAGDLFSAEVLEGSEFASDVRIVSQAELNKAVARETYGIGFGALARKAAEGTRAMSIKRVYSSTPVEPSEDAISNRIYPISRYCFCYLNPAANQDQIKAFLDWVRGDQGQQTAREAGFFPLPPKWRVSQ